MFYPLYAHKLKLFFFCPQIAQIDTNIFILNKLHKLKNNVLSFLCPQIKIILFLPTNRTNKHKYFYFKQIAQIYRYFIQVK